MGLYRALFGDRWPGPRRPKTPHHWEQYFSYIGGHHGYTLASRWVEYDPEEWQPSSRFLDPLLNPYCEITVEDLRPSRRIPGRGRFPHTSDTRQKEDYQINNLPRVHLNYKDELEFFTSLYEKAVYAENHGIPYVPIEPEKSKTQQHRKSGSTDRQSKSSSASNTSNWTNLKRSAQVPATPDLSPSRSSSTNAESEIPKSQVSWKIPRPPRRYVQDFIDAEGNIHPIKEFNSEYLVAMIAKYEREQIQAKADRKVSAKAKKAIRKATRNSIGRFKSPKPSFEDTIYTNSLPDGLKPESDEGVPQ